MARVASRWVSITEPARAAITNLAVRLGLALSREESGNPVARLDPATIERRLREAGFSRVRSQRYAMYYRHYPGSIFARLSGRGLLGPTIWGWRAANAVIGRKGNKLATFGERR
jgi:hypothetical protein